MSVRMLVWLGCLLPVAVQAQERYGFVAMLGRDTISVERVSRTRNRIVSDQIERFPQAIRHHTELLLGADQRVRHLTMEIVLPNAITPKWHRRTVTVEYLKDSLRMTIRNGEGSRSMTFAGTGDAVPWAPQIYSLTELYVAAAMTRSGDTVQMRHYYPDIQIEDLPYLIKINPGGMVRKLPDNQAKIYRHDALAGFGLATVDADHRMLSYSGAGSTYKVLVSRVTAVPDIDAIAAGFAEVEKRQGGATELSVRDTTRGQVGSASFVVDYGRPLARGRTLVGDVLPLDQVWRTGANAATQFTTSAPVTVAGLELAPGTYTLWSLPQRGGVTLIVNRQFGQWGTQYDSTRDLGRASYVLSKPGSPVEKFTISFVQQDAYHGSMVLEWGDFHWVAPIVVR